MKTNWAALAATMVCIGLAGCSATSVVPVSANEVRVSVDAHPGCGPTRAQELAVDEAAVATISKGFDRFAVMELGESSVATGVFHSPSSTTAYGSTLVTSPTYSGAVRRHHLTVNVLMFRNDDPGAELAVDARQHLGADWRKKVEDGVSC